MDSITVISYLVVAISGLRLLINGLNGFTGNLVNVNVIAPSFVSGWLWGLWFQFLSLLPSVTAIYSNSFTASGIFKRNQGLGFQLSFIFGFLLVSLLVFIALSSNWTVLLLVGAVLYFQSYLPRLNAIGQLLVGFSLLALGGQEFTHLVSQSFSTVNEVTIFHYLADNRAVVQLALFSLAAAIGFLFPSLFLVLVGATLLRYSSLISIENWIFLVGGQIFGELLLVVHASRKLTSRARHNSFVITISFLFAFCLALFLSSIFYFEYFGKFGEMFSVLVAMYLAHVFVGALPLTSILTNVISPIAVSKEMQKLTFTHAQLALSPAFGIAHLQNEIRKLAAMVQTMMELTSSQMAAEDVVKAREKIEKYEIITDNIQSEVREYAGDLTRAHLSAASAVRLRVLIRITESLESIADHCRAISVGIVEELEDDERKVLVDNFERLNILYEGVFPDLTANEFFHAKSSGEIEQFMQEMDDNRSLFANSYPRLIDIYMRFMLIVSRIENISEAIVSKEQRA